MTVEGMHEDVDFRSSIKRTEFEALAEKHGVMECAVKPLQTILESLPDHNVTLKDIEVVEIIGGATRVPFIKTALSKALGGRSLDVHLDADEAVAMGAGLFAANMSTTFRMRKFGAADAAAYGLEVDLNDKEKPNERKPLIPKHKRFPVRRIVTIQNATEDRTFTVYHNVSDGQVLPPGIVEPTLGEFAVTGVKDAMEKHDNILGKINAHFAVDNSGILYMDKAEYQVEVFDMVEVEEPPPPKKAPAKEDKKDKKKGDKKGDKKDDKRKKRGRRVRRLNRMSRRTTWLRKKLRLTLKLKLTPTPMSPPRWAASFWRTKPCWRTRTATMTLRVM